MSEVKEDIGTNGLSLPVASKHIVMAVIEAMMVRQIAVAIHFKGGGTLPYLHVAAPHQAALLKAVTDAASKACDYPLRVRIGIQCDVNSLSKMLESVNSAMQNDGARHGQHPNGRWQADVEMG